MTGPSDSSVQLAAAVPLVEQLRCVPADAVLRIDTPNALGCADSRSIPVGRICHEAAAALPVAALSDADRELMPPEGYEWRADAKAFVRHNANGTDSVYNPLPDIARELNVMIGSAIQHGDGDWVTGYTIKTGALHRILGVMQNAGHSVVIPNGLAKEPAEPAETALLQIEQCLRHFTRTPSSLADTQMRGQAHAAIAALRTRLLRHSEGKE